MSTGLEATFPFSLLRRASTPRALLVFRLLNISAPFSTRNERQPLQPYTTVGNEIPTTIRHPGTRLRERPAPLLTAVV